MIVLVVGMQRSGSTFAFNVARDVWRARGRVYQEAWGEVDLAGVLARAGGAEHILLKTHTPGPEAVALARHGAVRAVCTTRRVEDAAASWIETFGWSEDETVACFKDWLAFYARFEGAGLLVPYEQLDRTPWRAAWRIARYLCPDAGAAEILRTARRYAKSRVKQLADRLQQGGEDTADMGFSYYHRDTFFHRRHVSSLRSRPAEERLAPDQLGRIRAQLAAPAAAANLP